jgi:hypothetical protein
MRTFLKLLICVNIFEVIYALEDFNNNGLNSVVITPPNAVSPDIVPPFTSDDGWIGGQPTYPISPCQSPCNSPSTQCPGYCGQTPQLCSSACQSLKLPPQTITVQVPVRYTKIVPEKVIRTIQKQPRRERVETIVDTVKECPKNHKMTEDENDIKRCVPIRESITSCPVDYILKDDKCIKKITTCANEHTKVMQNCALRVKCPQGYHQRGNECILPTPQCSYGWNWNGKVCEPERLTCPAGYILGQNNQCEHEIQKCPSNYKEYGNQCIKEEPGCGYGFYMNADTNVCEKTVNKCPPDSHEQFGECVKIIYECPSGSKDVGNYCTLESIVQRPVEEM